MVGDTNSAGEYRTNGAGLKDAIEIGGTDSTTIWER